MGRLLLALRLWIRLKVSNAVALLAALIHRRVRFDHEAAQPSVIILSFIEWQGAFQRPQHLAMQLGERGYRVYYFSLLRLHRALKFPEWLEYEKGKDVADRVTVVTPLAFPLDTRIPLFSKLNNAILRQSIRHHCSKGAQPHLIVNAPYFNSVVFSIESVRLLYDIMDELTADAGSTRLKKAEARLIRDADAVTSGTWSVAERKKALREDITFIACGVEYEHFARAASPSTTVPEDITTISSPIAGYFGAVNERIDYGLVAEVAQQLPDIHFLFIGPVSVNVSRLRSFRNISFMGRRHYGELPAYLKSFDVALVPYKVSGGVETVNPVKVLEYLAGGKPVVSTNLPDVQRFYGECVVCTGDAGTFTEAIRSIVAEPGSVEEKVRKGQRLARRRSWEAMARDFAERLHLPLEEE